MAHLPQIKQWPCTCSGPHYKSDIFSRSEHPHSLHQSLPSPRYPWQRSEDRRKHLLCLDRIIGGSCIAETSYPQLPRVLQGGDQAEFRTANPIKVGFLPCLKSYDEQGMTPWWFFPPPALQGQGSSMGHLLTPSPLCSQCCPSTRQRIYTSPCAHPNSMVTALPTHHCCQTQQGDAEQS